MLKKRFAAGLFLSALLSSQAFAGTQAILVDTLSPKASKTTISTEGAFLKFEHLVDQDNTQMIFDKSKQEILIVDHKEKTFTRVDQAFIAKVSKQMEMVKKQLANIPPEQREMMEKMMGDKIPTGLIVNKPVAKSTYKKTGRKLKAGGHDCKITEKHTAGVKEMEFCVADTGKLSGGKELFAITKNMMSMFDSLMKSMPSAYEDNPLEEMNALDGFPIIVTHFENGKADYRMELESMNKKTFDKDFFKHPQGYKEQSIPEMGMGSMY